MSEADLHILKESIRFIEGKVHRDYFELSNLQGTNKNIIFLNKTIEWLNNKLNEFFSEKRRNYSLIIGDQKVDENLDSNYEIFVNSIVGIKNLLHGIPYFATTISISKEKKIVMAIVNNYAANETFYAVEGKGAFVNDRKIRVSNRSITDNVLIGIKYNKTVKFLNKILPLFPTFRIGNCSVLDSCYTACGRYDANIIFNGKENNLKISELFIKESGGLYHAIDDKSFIFSNSIIHSDIKKILEQNG